MSVGPPSRATPPSTRRPIRKLSEISEVRQSEVRRSMISILAGGTIVYLAVVVVVSAISKGLAGDDTGLAWVDLLWTVGLDPDRAAVVVTALLVLSATVSVAVVANSLRDDLDEAASAESYLWATAVGEIAKLGAGLAVAVALSQWRTPAVVMLLLGLALLTAWLASATVVRENSLLELAQVESLSRQSEEMLNRERVFARVAESRECPSRERVRSARRTAGAASLALGFALWPILPAVAAVVGAFNAEPPTPPGGGEAVFILALMTGFLTTPTLVARLRWMSSPQRSWLAAVGWTLLGAMTLPALALIGGGDLLSATWSLLLLLPPIATGLVLTRQGLRAQGPFRWVHLSRTAALCQLAQRRQARATELARQAAANRTTGSARVWRRLP